MIPYNRDSLPESRSPYGNRQEDLLDRIQLNHRKFEDDVAWRWIPPEGKPTSCLVALHGMGQDGSGLARLLQHLTERGVALLTPDGPYRHEVRERGTIREGHSWYIYTGDQQRFLDSMQKSEKDLLGLVEKVLDSNGIDGSRTILLGFSQGGYMAGFIACRHPERFANCIIASARLKHEFLEDELSSGKLPALLLLHDENDPLTQPDPVRESLRILSQSGADVTLDWHSDGHQLGEGSITSIERWLESRGLLG
ncbi:MAG: prolyl oligopeptidase family serine peptidase [Planctomycetota bacterium]